MHPKRLRESPHRFQWSDELVELLGKVTDTRVAELAGVSLTTVRAERRRRGIPSFDRRRPAFTWTPESVAMLGRDTDANVAAELDVHPCTVARERRIRGIPSFTDRRGRRTSARTWTAEEVAMLGAEPDSAVAESLGISVSCVAMKRKVLGIPPLHTPPTPVDWTRERLALLGTIPDLEVARRLGTTPLTVRKKRERHGIPPLVQKGRMYERTPELEQLLELPDREIRRRTAMSQTTIYKLRAEYEAPAPRRESSRWTPEVEERLGKEPDSSVARDLGITPGGVFRRRRELGIGAFAERPPWTEAEVALLGVVPDRQVAETVGRSLQAVRSKRHALKIPPPG